MTDYLILGGIGLARLLSPGNLGEKKAAAFAAHDIVTGRTLLQFTGFPCDELSLKCHFHADFCVPEEVWGRLLDLLSKHRSFPVTTGAGRMLGTYVLTDLEQETTWSAADGTMYAIDCTLGLKQYEDANPLLSAVAEQAAGAPGLAGNGAATVRKGGRT
jgi:phage protein U